MTGLGWAGLDWTRPGKRKNRNHPRGFFPLIIIHLFVSALDFFLFHICPIAGQWETIPCLITIIIIFFSPRALFCYLFPFSGRLWQGKDTKVLGYNLGLSVCLACGLCVHDEIPGIQLIRRRTGFFLLLVV